MGHALARIAIWAARLLEYAFAVEYLQGHSNVIEDCLSRLPQRCEESTDSDPDLEDEMVAHIVGILPSSLTEK